MRQTICQFSFMFLIVINQAVMEKFCSRPSALCTTLGSKETCVTWRCLVTGHKRA